MKRWIQLCLILCLGLGALFAQGPYHCPPCNSPCDAKIYDAPGTCPHCGMSLEGPKAPRKRVAILLFEGVQIIDFTGPYEIFGQAGYDVFTVAEKPGGLTTAMGLKVTPAESFDSCPRPDIVVIPGGDISAPLESAVTQRWIQARAKEAEIVMSVCNGALILAKTGLMDGRTMTTFHRALGPLAAQSPKVKVVFDRRFVDEGKFISTAGLSSGIDGALHVVERLEGKGRAQDVALNVEYHWQPEVGFARAALADREIPQIQPKGVRSSKILRTEGDRSSWNAELEMDVDAGPEAFEGDLRQALTAKGWTCTSHGQGRSQWRFTGREQRAWTATLVVKETAPQRYIVQFELHRA